MDDTDWLMSLKPGDEVAVGIGMVPRHTLHTVDRVTKTQIALRGIVACYSKTTGKQLGSRGLRSVLVEPTEQVRAAIRRTELMATQGVPAVDPDLMDFERPAGRSVTVTVRAVLSDGKSYYRMGMYYHGLFEWRDTRGYRLDVVEWWPLPTEGTGVKV